MAWSRRPWVKKVLPAVLRAMISFSCSAIGIEGDDFCCCCCDWVCGDAGSDFVVPEDVAADVDCCGVDLFDGCCSDCFEDSSVFLVVPDEPRITLFNTYPIARRPRLPPTASAIFLTVEFEEDCCCWNCCCDESMYLFNLMMDQV